MNSRTLTLFFLLVLCCLLILAYYTAGLINNAYVLHQYRPPSQEAELLQRIEKDITDGLDKLGELEQRLQDLENVFGRAETYEVTAYTHVAVPGVADVNGTGDGITASGLPVREGIVAVDQQQIPLGSKVWVEGFGVLLAADVGGSVIGKRLDVFRESRKEAMQIGRQKRLAVVFPKVLP